MAKYVVTGGAGFIGSTIAGNLLASGQRVRVIDNFDPYYPPERKRRNISGFLKDSRFLLIEGDIRDGRVVRDAFKGADFIIHVAAQAGVPVSITDPVKCIDVNVKGTAEVLSAARDLGIKKVVVASSSSVYGKAHYLPFDEDHPTVPLSPYGVSKLGCEHLCRVFSDLYSMDVPHLRYFTVYGPRMRPELGISVFTASAIQNLPISIFGDGSRSRSFTYVDDIARASILATEKGRGVPYNIGGELRISISDLVGKIMSIAKSTSRITYASEKPGDMEHTGAKNDRARTELGWIPKIDIDAGLKLFYDWMKADLGSV